MDDDVEFVKGTPKDFQKLLLEYLPGMGVPLCDQILETHRYNPTLRVQRPIGVDQIVQAYRTDLVDIGLAVPYVTTLDNFSWWYACQINEYISLYHHYKLSAQFNEIQIKNMGHDWQNKKEDSNSKYQSGLTLSGLDNCRKIINGLIGPQPRFLGSIYHPKFLPRPTFAPNFRQILNNYSVRGLVKSVYDFTFLLRTLIYNSTFRKFCSSKILHQEPFPVSRFKRT